MEDKLDEVYNWITEAGISILDLYIYDYLLNEDYNLSIDGKSIGQKIKEIKQSYNNDYYCKGIDYHINKIISGNDDEDDYWEDE